MTEKDILRRLDEIESRVSGATPGPWVYIHAADALDSPKIWSNTRGRVFYGDVDDTDGEFIAHARDDVPWLVKTCRELLDQLYKLEEVVEKVRDLASVD